MTKINTRGSAFFSMRAATAAVTLFPQQIQISLLKEADAFGKIFVQSAASFATPKCEFFLSRDTRQVGRLAAR